MRVDMNHTFKIISRIYSSNAGNFLSENNFPSTRDITSCYLYNIQTLPLENGSCQSVLPISGIIFLQASCVSNRLDKCWVDLQIKFYHDAPFNFPNLHTH